MADAERDGNNVPTLLGVSSVDGVTPVRVYANPITHRLLVDTPSGSGSVTDVSVVSANGLAGSVATSTTTPAITLSTTITGILKGNGTSISAVTIGSGLSFDGTTLSATGSGTGDVVGPASATDNAIARFDTTTGKLIQNSAVTVADTTGVIAGTQGVTFSGATSGTTALIPTAIAGTTTLTLPAATDTLVGLATTDTLTNKTLTSPKINENVVLTTTATKLNYLTSATGTTGTASTNVVFSTSPALTTPTVTTTINPSANDGAALGASGTAWSDLFLANGGVINWNAGDTTLTHSADTLTQTSVNAGSTGAIYELYQNSASPAAADTVGLLKFFGNDSGAAKQEYARISGLISSTTAGAEVGYLVFSTTVSGTLTSRILLDNLAFYPATNDGVPLGTGTTSWSDLFLASGGVINFNNGNYTLTHSAGLLTANGAFSIGTSNALTAGTIELGAASDTTLARVSAGVVSIEGANIMTVSAAQTVTGQNKFNNIIDVNNAITATGNAATVPVTYRLNTVTNNSAATLTITMTTTSAVDGQMTIVRILDFSAAAQTITWVNTENSTVTAPVTSNGSTTLPLTVGFMYNNATSKWRCIASA